MGFPLRFFTGTIEYTHCFICLFWIIEVSINVCIFSLVFFMVIFAAASIIQGWKKLFLGARLFGRTILLGWPKPKWVYVRSRYNYKHCFLLYINETGLAAFILNVFSSIDLQWGFCSLMVVLMSKIRCASKNNFHASEAFV